LRHLRRHTVPVVSLPVVSLDTRGAVM